MKVEIAYEGRIEAFDTDRFTEAQPFSGRSMLADFELRYGNAEVTYNFFVSANLKVNSVACSI